MKHGSYEIVTINSGKEDGDAILAILQAMKTKHKTNDLSLLNYCYEMPINFNKPTFLGCEGGVIELEVNQQQAIVIKNQKQTFMHSIHFPRNLAVHAMAEYVNLKNKYVMLGRFAFVRVPAERRMAVRVRIEENIPVRVNSTSGYCSARLVDLSLGGVKLLNADISAELPEYQLEMTLLGERVYMTATFLREKESENGNHKVFTIEPDKRTETIISRLIYHRQVEIIHMLKEQLALE